MEYQNLTRAEQATMVTAVLKDLEKRHFDACMNVITNLHAKPSLIGRTCPQCGDRAVQDDPALTLAAHTVQRDNLAEALAGLRHEYAGLLAEVEGAAAVAEEGDVHRL